MYALYAHCALYALCVCTPPHLILSNCDIMCPVPVTCFQFIPGQVWEQSKKDFDAMYAVNVTGVFLSMKYQIAAMKASGKGGVIINNGSVAGTLTLTLTLTLLMLTLVWL